MDRQDYRRTVGTDIWHWNPSCPKWPDKAFECTGTKPAAGKECPQCGGPA